MIKKLLQKIKCWCAPKASKFQFEFEKPLVSKNTIGSLLNEKELKNFQVSTKNIKKRP